MKICPQCSKEIDEAAGYCPACGYNFAASRGQDLPAEQLPGIINELTEQLKYLGSRLERIERRLGMIPVSRTADPAPKKEQPAVVQKESRPVDKPAVVTKSGDIESRIGLVWFNRIGLVALLFGAAFFLKYAFDNRWIGELGRVVLGLLAGFGMILGSESARRKNYAVIAQGFHGGGVAIIYLSIFVAFALYRLIDAVPTFIFMGAVTAYCGLWAVRTNWMSSAVIGIAGGFLVPFLIGFGLFNLYLGVRGAAIAMLFPYIALLDLGVLFMGFYKKWEKLNLITFVCTQLVFCQWYIVYYNRAYLPGTISCLTLFFIIFSLLSVTRNIIHKERSHSSDILLVVLNGAVYFTWLFSILRPVSFGVPGLIPLLLGCVYIGFAYSALIRRKEDKKLILAYVGMAVFFVTVAIPVQLRYNWVAIGWVIESLVLIKFGFNLNYPDVRKIGLAIGALGLVKAVCMDHSYSAYSYCQDMFFLNERMLASLVIVPSVFLAAMLYGKYKDKVSADEKTVSTALFLLANFLILLQLSMELKTYFAHMAYAKALAYPDLFMGRTSNFHFNFHTEYGKLFGARELCLSLLWVAYAFIIVAVGIYRKFRALRLMALALFGLAVFKIFLIDLSYLERLYRIVSFIVLGVVLIAVSFFYQKYKDEINSALLD